MIKITPVSALLRLSPKGDRSSEGATGVKNYNSETKINR